MYNEFFLCGEAYAENDEKLGDMMMYPLSKLVCLVVILPLMLLGLTSSASAEANFKIQNFTMNEDCPVYINWKKPSIKNDVITIRGVHPDGSVKIVIDLGGLSPTGKVIGPYIRRSELSHAEIDTGLRLTMKMFTVLGVCSPSFTATRIGKLKGKSGNSQSGQETANENNDNLTNASSKLDKAKSTCTELGFKLGTEKHGECVLKMFDY